MMNFTLGRFEAADLPGAADDGIELVETAAAADD